MELQNKCEQTYEKYQKYWEDIEKAKGNEIFLEDKADKTDFLKWLAQEKDVLSHGSNNPHIELLEPRQANCASKKSGNLKAVYAVLDPILPQFYAINTRLISGMAKSGKWSDSDYRFSVTQEMLENKEKAFGKGFVYILPKHSFEMLTNDNGKPSGEWGSFEKVAPLAKIAIEPKEFSYFLEIKAL
jgi:hypothetical protein